MLIGDSSGDLTKLRFNLKCSIHDSNDFDEIQNTIVKLDDLMLTEPEQKLIIDLKQFVFKKQNKLKSFKKYTEFYTHNTYLNFVALNNLFQFTS
jgi:hypothetical protein